MVNPVISGLGCIDKSDRSMEAKKITEDINGIGNHSPCKDTYTWDGRKSIGKLIGGFF